MGIPNHKLRPKHAVEHELNREKKMAAKLGKAKEKKHVRQRDEDETGVEVEASGAREKDDSRRPVNKKDRRPWKKEDAEERGVPQRHSVLGRTVGGVTQPRKAQRPVSIYDRMPDHKQFDGGITSNRSKS